MDHALLQVGLPVACAIEDCEIKGFVKPQSDYGGWYKAVKRFTAWKKRWFCPEHYDEGKKIDHLYDNFKTPVFTPIVVPDSEPDEPEDIEKLYALID